MSIERSGSTTKYRRSEKAGKWIKNATKHSVLPKDNPPPKNQVSLKNKPA